jgi:NADH-quinone oxidoreductase subunit E
MAWQIKPSATTEYAKRDEPFLTQAMQKRYTTDLLPRYENSRGALMPILNDLQHTYRFIAYQAMVEVAKFLQITPADVMDTVTFYEEYTTEPTGEHIIAVCQSIACEICGHQTLLDHLRRKLDIEPHETTEDGRFTLLTLECLGSCDTAPVALIGDTLHENLTIEKVDHIIDQL